MRVQPMPFRARKAPCNSNCVRALRPGQGACERFALGQGVRVFAGRPQALLGCADAPWEVWRHCLRKAQRVQRREEEPVIAVVDYHKGNLKSVERGLVGVGADARITDDVREIAAADAIVLPGVGAFADAMGALVELGQAKVLRERIDAGVPFLGICLGLHLLYEAGEEHAEGAPTPGLGLIPGTVGALPKTDMRGNKYKIPHVGWNSVEYLSARPNPLFKGIPDGEFFYFTHSFAAPRSCETIATTTHSVTFPSAVQVGQVCFAVQFHPEKSSDAGAQLLANFVALT